MRKITLLLAALSLTICGCAKDNKNAVAGQKIPFIGGKNSNKSSERNVVDPRTKSYETTSSSPSMMCHTVTLHVTDTLGILHQKGEYYSASNGSSFYFSCDPIADADYGMYIDGTLKAIQTITETKEGTIWTYGTDYLWGYNYEVVFKVVEQEPPTENSSNE